MKKEHLQIFEPFPPIETDPFVNLDILCVSLITHIRESLLQSDFSMCLALLLKYEAPEDVSQLITRAIAIKKKVFADAWHLVDDDDFGGAAKRQKIVGIGKQRHDSFADLGLEKVMDFAKT